MTKPPKPPRHLSAAARRLWKEITGTWALEPHHRAVLVKALEAADRAEEARLILARDGLTVNTDGGGVKPHPAVGIERDSRMAFARLIAQLGLDVSEVPSAADLRTGRT